MTSPGLRWVTIAGLVLFALMVGRGLWLTSVDDSWTERAQTATESPAPERLTRETGAGPPSRNGAPLPSATTLRAPSTAPSPATRAEPARMGELRQLAASDPARALELIEQLDAAYPDGEGAAERGALRVRALVDLDRISDARVAATRVMRQHPGKYADQVRRLTGVHLVPTREEQRER